MSRTSKSNTKHINLALQGGGAHGAFTWGVLDRLLEDDSLRIEAISGTSAGAMNAVVVADGLMQSGHEGAREKLRQFWKAVSDTGRNSPIQRSLIDVFMGNWSLDNSPSYVFFDLFSRLASPYEINPLNLNPLQELLEEVVDFDRVRSCDRMKIFISATNVETGRVKVFDRQQLTPEMIMASACLPHLFQAVEVDGVPYWDGGYMGNPVLFPFFSACVSCDVIIVQINPIFRSGAPKSAREIMDRVNEITFNSSLLREFRAIDFVGRLLDDGKLHPKDYKKVFVHRIEADEEIKKLGASSKMNAEWAFLEYLFGIGRQAADTWIDANIDRIGKESTLDLRAMFNGAVSEGTPPIGRRQ